ncbi:MAG: HNH endonuclease signature motif containing protein [Sphingobium sp.]
MVGRSQKLDDAGRRLLEVLFRNLKRVRAGRPETYIGYKEALDALGLSSPLKTHGASLQAQGLDSLAEWTHREGHPAVTGLIINMETYRPGPGYFKLFDRDPEDFDWWAAEIERSLTYDWASYLGFPSPGKETAREIWSEEELRAAVAAYLAMFEDWREERPLNKAEIYRQLGATFGRSAKAFEYRMQNISYVLSLMGRDWLSGLKPASNVGTKNAIRIERLILEIEGKPGPHVVTAEMAVLDALAKHFASPPKGSKSPEVQTSQSMQFKRDFEVKAWVLEQADGICECCEQPAPFKRPDGRAYLEVHHVRTLADGGSDTVENAVAVCPNCHCALHYSLDSKVLAERLYERVVRLNLE